ncbi:MAG TPA: HDOD domain-containing protein, partial [Clostridia bacterium]|nr:HDOD domain-containing protein [Clostridia bacterium]
MDVYIARQPIFNRQMRVYGYELLYRKTQNNFYEGTDDDEATVSLINNTFLVFGLSEIVDNTRAFINFSENLLLDEIVYMLPKDKVIIEILEHVQPTDDVIEACTKLKQSGYTIALDDFVLEKDTDRYEKLIQTASVIKIEFPSIHDGNSAHMAEMIKRYPRIEFLAEKVETQEEFQYARELGFQLFQGYFFSRPMMKNATDIDSLNANLIMIFNELGRKEPDYRTVMEGIQRDVGLSYKLLKMANSVYYGSSTRINSVKGMLVQIGTDEVRRWVQLMMLRGVQRPENAELIKNSIVRAKMLSLIANELGNCSESDYFIAGMFSSLDSLLNTSMDKALTGLPISDEVRDALMGIEGNLRCQIDTVIGIERADWSVLESKCDYLRPEPEKYMDYYMQSLRWQQAMAQ